MPDRQTRKYLRLIGKIQNAIPKQKVVKRTIKSKDKMEFSIEADANKEEVYRNLSNLLIDSDKNILFTLTSIQYGDKRTWEVDSL